MRELELDLVSERVASIIQQGRLGNPSFLRCTTQVNKPSLDLQTVLDQILKLAEHWFNGAPEKTYHLESTSANIITVSAKWAGGQGAMISIIGIPFDQAPKLDIVLLGGRGAVYFDTDGM